MKKIVTKNLYLRQLTVDDVSQNYLSGLQDPEVTQFTEARHTKWDKEKMIRYIEESNVEGVSQLVGIFLRKIDKHIGNVRLSSINPLHKRLEFGITLFDKSEWGKGFGTEAIEGICTYVFEVMGFYKICADYYSINKASAKIFQKLGFSIEGVFKDHFKINDHYVDSVRIAKFNHTDSKPTKNSV
ncbi:MAG: hypothetical protein A3J59_03420 [Candidatus Buchananbacteria bacterium RIFCSPHIGHO2_02_FULL_56_16]|uniref:N-acetyltransferase domain-containing protein n=1 Tax=Candidatus Buchananbacteria bacterium RIFCSPHIGHO2_02_FULL_56_16 TaxID=1797542 RepID=A0A1G1YK31_9BACT|nr:MAG: hypothetical protein A3J59_03420 [Candidatus Buchananbacteria bacterium RIFCSPHIGHO2_02_FULL_56_16]